MTVPILCIDISWSKCLNCGRGADPQEHMHTSLMGYGVDPTDRGCGVTWTKVTSAYVGVNMKDRSQTMRPDLEWVDYSDAITIVNEHRHH